MRESKGKELREEILCKCIKVRKEERVREKVDRSRIWQQ